MYLIELGHAFRKIRQKKRYSMQYVANQANVDIGIIRKLEHGQTRVYLDQFIKLCYGYGVSPSSIVLIDANQDEKIHALKEIAEQLQ